MRLEGQFDTFIYFYAGGSLHATDVTVPHPPFPAISDAMVRLDPRAFSVLNCYSNGRQAIHLVSLEWICQLK